VRGCDFDVKGKKPALRNKQIKREDSYGNLKV